ncbi:MAG: hypothetical protein B7Y43_18380 [Sphingomonas sp. 28-62-20]|uniref:antiviral reverse transcriptase Drt3a n=1 Tax=Sphingomonas sp. 28-62-20 TaxID=1970433 RepID=UPI000BC94F3A|nr:MAG: hypothetical protein B7Y43_18380 [Sphingomonas sp. 28-62-20]
MADRQLADPNYKQAIIERAVTLGQNGFPALAVQRNNLRGKTVYQLKDLSERLVVRHINRNIRRLTGVKQDNREFIIKCVSGFLSEGTRYRAYKFDVKAFYESVSPIEIVRDLEADEGFSGQSAAALSSFFVEMGKLGVTGLPRGLGLSATLAEYLLRPFDARVSDMAHVWFYARFVDDIFIITDGNEDQSRFTHDVAAALPSGLTFNSKSTAFTFDEYRNGSSGVAHAFDFLGYRFTVNRPERRRVDSRIGRQVMLDIAPSKVRRIKTRIALSLVQFKKDHSYADLVARIRLLTSNFNFIDRGTGVRRVAGIYFNYPLVDFDRSTALPSLDKFLRNSVLSNHPKNHVYPAVTAAERRGLAQLSFSDGFKDRRFFSFGPARLVELTACWSHA